MALRVSSLREFRPRNSYLLYKNFLLDIYET